MTAGLTWGPPALAAGLVGALGFILWLILSPPGRDGRLRGALRAAAALLLLLALLDVGCRSMAPAAGRRLVVLLDRSLSMEVAGSGGKSRAALARTWLTGARFKEWSAGWSVTVDSFGGATTDPGAAVEATAAGLPDAILVVSDGRAAGGRAVEPAAVPLYTWAPEPISLADVAVVELEIVEPEGAPPEALVEVAAVGGRSLDGVGEVSIAIDGRPAGRRAVAPLGAGERQVVRVPLPESTGPRRVEARVTMPADQVSANDRRARIWEGAGGPRRALAVGLVPGWDFAAWLRALEGAHPGPVDGFWSDAGGRFYRVDGAGDSRAWAGLDPARYGVAYLLGDPAALGGAGRAWVARFLGSGGRGLLWGPEGHSGPLAGAEFMVPGAPGRVAVPSLTPVGADWLIARGASPERTPDGSPAWPPLEGLPADALRLPAAATVLLETAGGPAAWLLERGPNRFVVALGTGYYRWPLDAAGGAPPVEAAGPVFWRSWTGALARWLAAASPAARPLVRMPANGRVPAGSRLEAPIATDFEADVDWRIVREPDGEAVASGSVEAGAPARAIVAGPFPPDAYELIAQAGGRRARERFVVETWAPDLAWTAADTASLAAAARASGGRLLAGGPLPPLPASSGAPPAPAEVRASGFGTAPWVFLLAAAFLLADWALARPARLAR